MVKNLRYKGIYKGKIKYNPAFPVGAKFTVRFGRIFNLHYV